MVPTSDRMRRELTSIRDTVESIWVAILMALVLRAFVVEAFVIPTGSMAPELMGEHWDLVCPACGFEYAFGGPKMTPPQEAEFRRSEPHIPQGARCPNCHRPYHDGLEFLSGGDRVLVLKYLYRFAPPQPFDVVVFRNPQNNRENYIKRLIGLPGETIEIVHGDIFVSPTQDAPRQIRRKPAVAQKAMWQAVFDNDYQPGDQEDARRPQPAMGRRRWRRLAERYLRAALRLWRRPGRGGADVPDRCRGLRPPLRVQRPGQRIGHESQRRCLHGPEAVGGVPPLPSRCDGGLDAEQLR